MDKRRLLKIKLKSLAAEARIIKLEEKRSRGDLRTELHEHRIHVVRRECRHTHLAYAYIRGREYRQVELTCELPPNYAEVMRMVKKYGLVDMDLNWFKAKKIAQAA